LSNLDLALGDNRTGEGGAEEVAAFILGVGLWKEEGGGEGEGKEGREGGRGVGGLYVMLPIKREKWMSLLMRKIKETTFINLTPPFVLDRVHRRGDKKGKGTREKRGGRPAAKIPTSNAHLDSPEDVLLHKLLAKILNVHLLTIAMNVGECLHVSYLRNATCSPALL